MMQILLVIIFYYNVLSSMLLSQGILYHLEKKITSIWSKKFHTFMIRLPGIEQSPAWLRDVQGCEGHWLRVLHQGQTLHTKNQDVPVLK